MGSVLRLFGFKFKIRMFEVILPSLSVSYGLLWRLFPGCEFKMLVSVSVEYVLVNVNARPLALALVLFVAESFLPSSPFQGNGTSSPLTPEK
jgi:hypothetical protein